MLSRWPIRYKLLVCVAELFLIVAILSFSSFKGVYAYRQVVRSISCRALELPLAAQLTAQVGELRFALRQVRPSTEFPGMDAPNAGLIRENFETQLLDVKHSLTTYQEALRNSDVADPFIGDKRSEKRAVIEIQACLDRISKLNEQQDWFLDTPHIGQLEREVDQLHTLAAGLPIHLQKKMRQFRDKVRVQYRTWIVLTWITSILTGVLLGLLVWLFYRWIFRPLRVLIRGSRLVAAGRFEHRIRLDSDDEMAELAAALNAMTSRFEQIRNDLDQQVKQRTREVLRSEQLASVGFLAAGVAHEINNPLASIAWCGEALESRLYDTLHATSDGDDEEIETEVEATLDDDEIKVLKTYLRRIQDEAFRCKGITEKLLDFSRIGDREHQDTDLPALVRDVIEMVRHLGKYREKRIEFECTEYIRVVANAQELKQVVLNLITNALDSSEPGGTVHVSLRKNDEQTQLLVRDNGCGMTDHVLEHLFEPFFTRRRGTQGTGLGLSIAYRIVTDHGGQIEAHSDGPGTGAKFIVTLPLSHHEEEKKQPARKAA